MALCESIKKEKQKKAQKKKNCIGLVVAGILMLVISTIFYLTMLNDERINGAVWVDNPEQGTCDIIK